MKDTDAATEASYRKRLMELAPGQRIVLASGMFDAVRTMIRGRLLVDLPDLSPGEVRVHLFEQIYGRDVPDGDRVRIAAALRRKPSAAGSE